MTAQRSARRRPATVSPPDAIAKTVSCPASRAICASARQRMTCPRPITVLPSVRKSSFMREWATARHPPAAICVPFGQDRCLHSASVSRMSCEIRIFPVQKPFPSWPKTARTKSVAFIHRPAQCGMIGLLRDFSIRKSGVLVDEGRDMFPFGEGRLLPAGEGLYQKTSVSRPLRPVQLLLT